MNTKEILMEMAVDKRHRDAMIRMLNAADTIEFKKLPNYWGIIDMDQHSSNKRFSIYDVSSKKIDTYLVAHGEGSDKNHNGFADKFSNENNSHCTSLGVYQCTDTYNGKHGLSLKLIGLDPTNSNADLRDIVIHGAEYVSEERAENGVKMGRSWGCPAVSMKKYKEVIGKLKHGSLLIIIN